MTSPIFDIQGHRGARGLFAENTLAGFVGALASGATSLELDIAVTRDGVPVVTHDQRLDPDLTRDADGRWLDGAGPAVAALTLAELRRFGVGRARPGSAVARAFPDQRSKDGARVPTLAEVLAATAASGALIHAELKTDPRDPALTVAPERMADLVLATADAAEALGRLTVRSFDWRGLAYLRRAAPTLPLAWLTDAETAGEARLWWDRDTAGLSTPRAVAAAAWQSGPIAWTPVWAPDHRGLRGDDVAEATALGLCVVPWTVNRPADMARLIGWGVAGLCTDRPDLARAVLVAHAAAARPGPPPPLAG